MATLNHIQNEIREIKDRNRRVELDKAWETSMTRTLIISFMTYIIIGSFLWVALIPDAWVAALVPTLAFMISTMTLPFFKGRWMSAQSRKKL